MIVGESGEIVLGEDAVVVERSNDVIAFIDGADFVRSWEILLNEGGSDASAERNGLVATRKRRNNDGLLLLFLNCRCRCFLLLLFWFIFHVEGFKVEFY